MLGVAGKGFGVGVGFCFGAGALRFVGSGGAGGALESMGGAFAVSYTHLTLPTILLV